MIERPAPAHHGDGPPPAQMHEAAPARVRTRHRARAIRGRQEELAVGIARLRGTVSSRRASMLVLTGPRGFGRSVLLAELAEQARRQGFAVGCGAAVGPGDGAAGAPPIAPLVAALRSGEAPLLSQQAFLQLHALSDQPLWFVDRLATILEQRASEQPVLIGIDDVHLADPFTVFALQVLPLRLAASPIVWMLTARAGEGPVDEIAASTGQRLEVTTYMLGPLDAGAVLELAVDHVGVEPHPRLRRQLEGGGGNPRLVVRLLEETVAAGWVATPDLPMGGGDELPPAFVSCLQGRLAAVLPAETLRLMQAGAVLGEFTLEDVAVLLGVPALELLPALEPAVNAGHLVDDGVRIRFGLELVRRGTYESLPMSARRIFHAAAVDHLGAVGRPAAELAPHLMIVATPGDGAVVRTLREAGAALAYDAPDRAVQVLQHAFELLDPGDASWADVAAEVITALARTRQHRSAVALAASVVHRVDVEAAGRVLLAAGRSWDALGQRDRLRELARGIEPAATSEDARRRMAVVAALAHNESNFEEARSAAACAVRQSRASGDTGTERAALLALAGLALDEGRFRVAVEHFADAAGRDGLAQAEEIEALVQLDQHDDVSNHLGRRADRLDAVGDEGGRALARARWWRATGQLEAATAAAEEACRLLPRDDEPVRHAAAVILLGEIALKRGRVAEARAQLSAASVGSAVPDHDLARAHLTAAVARAGEGVVGQEIRELIMPALGRSMRGEPDHVVDAVRWAVEAGDREAAKELTRVAGDLAVRNPLVGWLAALADHAAGVLDADVPLLERAVERLERTPRQLALAAAAADLGAALLTAGRRSSAVLALDRAWGIYRRLGADGEAGRVRRQLRAAGVRRHRWSDRPARPTTGWAALTDAEVRVAELVAAGHSNREVAAHLVVSPNTVATHLRSAFGKLQVTSRVQLTRIVLEQRR